jgi:chemotaxis protein methyltransferase CheR
METITITDQEFAQFQAFVYQVAGIRLSTGKKPLVAGRLLKRLKHYHLTRYGDYFRLMMRTDHHAELQMALDLLTTNETSFFREPAHFDFLRQHVVPNHRPGRALRVWSGACSSGEEPYSIAMVLADCLGESPWEILASDISTRVVAQARSAQYAIERAHQMPQHYLVHYCLKGIGSQAGTFRIEKKLRHRVRFLVMNLNTTLPQIGEFDVVFLRNVMIYFDTQTKQQVVDRILTVLRPGGYFIIGHSESLQAITEKVHMVQPSVYRKGAP